MEFKEKDVELKLKESLQSEAEGAGAPEESTSIQEASVDSHQPIDSPTASAEECSTVAKDTLVEQVEWSKRNQPWMNVVLLASVIFASVIFALIYCACWFVGLPDTPDKRSFLVLGSFLLLAAPVLLRYVPKWAQQHKQNGLAKIILWLDVARTKKTTRRTTIPILLAIGFALYKIYDGGTWHHATFGGLMIALFFFLLILAALLFGAKPKAK